MKQGGGTRVVTESLLERLLIVGSLSDTQVTKGQNLPLQPKWKLGVMVARLITRSCL